MSILVVIIGQRIPKTAEVEHHTADACQPDPPLHEDNGLTIETTNSRQPGFYTYYRPTAMDRTILEYGVEELMRREREFSDIYA